MQIVIKLLNPRSLTISFVYERTSSQSSTDEIDEALSLLAERLSTSISSEPFNIEKYPSVTISSFSTVDYRSDKIINLIFQCFTKNGKDFDIDEEKTISLILYFDIADKEYTHNIIEANKYISITREAFDNLDTLITDTN
ncbi:MAG: hypothetical protein IPK90_08085 [Chitinophagaceae bacterium]|nr:hypothetical protein [Chitinophagaceae bacterium]